ncbi:MAG TPA: hypothetical protein PKA74_04185 [Bauldia sp.]|nr:hypothetical protein [Bauldia sp.]
MKPFRSDDLAATEMVFGMLLDRRIAEMRRLLAEMQPDSTADALRALRDAFPDAPLGDRLEAIRATRH